MSYRREKVKFIILRTIGNFFVLFSIWMMLMTFGPAIVAEITYRLTLARNISYVLADTETEVQPQLPSPTPYSIGNVSFFGQLTGGNRVERIQPVSAQYSIVIPKIGANAPILPNIDPGNPEIYLPALRQGVAHAMGTVFPGISGNTFLFAHSTDSFWNVGRYNAVFYLLKELENGDEIDIFYQGKRYIYRVVNKLIVEPSEVRFLTEQTAYEQLTLQTCWPPGTTYKRLIVLARLEKDLLK